ncbi:MAG: hypothetical protein ACKVWV_13005, partial [Planctomycetota bacterium]
MLRCVEDAITETFAARLRAFRRRRTARFRCALAPLVRGGRSRPPALFEALSAAGVGSAAASIVVTRTTATALVATSATVAARRSVEGTFAGLGRTLTRVGGTLAGFERTLARLGPALRGFVGAAASIPAVGAIHGPVARLRGPVARLRGPVARLRGPVARLRGAVA